MTITNQNQLRRTLEAITETSRLIERELAYQPKFRKAGYLAFLEGHAAKLAQMISEYREAA
jgi:hypothetical protein